MWGATVNSFAIGRRGCCFARAMPHPWHKQFSPPSPIAPAGERSSERRDALSRRSALGGAARPATHPPTRASRASRCRGWDEAAHVLHPLSQLRAAEPWNLRGNSVAPPVGERSGEFACRGPGALVPLSSGKLRAL